MNKSRQDYSGFDVLDIVDALKGLGVNLDDVIDTRADYLKTEKPKIYAKELGRLFGGRLSIVVVFDDD